MKNILVIIIILILNSYSFSEQNNLKCNKIISFSPSLSLVLEKLDLISNVIGRSSYDNLHSLREVQIIGDLFQPNLELIYQLKPSIVFLLNEHRTHSKKLSQLKINYNAYTHNNLAGIKNSIRSIGNYCGKKELTKKKLEELLRAENSLKQKFSNTQKKEIMIVIGNSINSDELYISGSDGFYSEILNLINASNIFKQKTTAKLSLTKEGFKKFNPDHLFFISPYLKKTCNRTKKHFSNLYNIKNEKITCFSSNLALIPSPKYILLAKKFAKVIH